MAIAPTSERPASAASVSERSAADRPQVDHDRRDHIAAAAERAFIRHGFHAATMQQVAEEASMSAGNLYRYFASKEALVEGICFLDQRERVNAFHALAHSGNLLGTLETMLRENVLNKPQHKTVMFLEVAAEAARNPRIAEMLRANDAEVMGGLAALIDAAKANGEADAGLDSRFAAKLMFTYVAGLFRRRALDAQFDIEAEAAMTVAMLRALFAGKIKSANPVETT